MVVVSVMVIPSVFDLVVVGVRVVGEHRVGLGADLGLGQEDLDVGVLLVDQRRAAGLLAREVAEGVGEARALQPVLGLDRGVLDGLEPLDVLGAGRRVVGAAVPDREDRAGLHGDVHGWFPLSGAATGSTGRSLILFQPNYF